MRSRTGLSAGSVKMARSARSRDIMSKTHRLQTLRTWIVCVLLTLTCHARSAEPIPSGPLVAGPIGFEFAVYFTDLPATDPMAALRLRLKTAGGLTLVTALHDKPAGALLQARVDTTVQKDYRPPDLEALQRFGRGLTREQAVALQRSERALILRFAHPMSVSMPAYRSALLLTEQVARDTNGLLWDEETREVFTPDEWHKRRLDSWSGDTPNALTQTVIHAYKGDKQVRAITLGMAKFGLPDIVVDDFSWSSNRSMGHLIGLLAQAMVEGATLKSSGVYDLDLRAIGHSVVRDSQLPTLKRNSTAVAKLSLIKGTPESGDPRNRLVEIAFDRYPGPDRYARQDAMLSALFGTEDSVTRVNHTRELQVASDAARAKLPGLKDAFNRGLQPGEYVLLKLPFATPKGGTEWMWVEVMSWDGDAISGLLKNEPMDIPTLHGGQIVKVSQSKVFDYLRSDANGRDEGNTTGAILQRMQEARK